MPTDGRPVAATASRALGWSLLNTAVSRLGTLGVGIALARMIGPEEFGTFAVATVALLAVLSFNELGVSLAIVRWPGSPDVIAPTVTTLATVTSAGIAVGGVLLAPEFASAMGTPDATPVVQLMMASVLINGLVATPAALLQRYFMQSRRMLIDQVNVWLGAAVSVVLAAVGLGAMSLAIGRVVGSAAAAALFLANSPARYRFGFDRSVLPGLLRFGLPLAGASIVVFAIGYSDQFAAGHVLGPVQLGFYVLAFNLASWPVSLFSQPLRSVAPAAFAAIQDDAARLRATFTSLVGVLGAVSVPCCLVIAGAASSIVTVVYGTEWQPASSALLWLGVFAAFRILFEVFYDYLVVLGRSGGLLRIQVVGFVFLVSAILAGARLGGIAGIAMAQVVVAAAVTLPMYLMELRGVGVRLRDVWRRIWFPVVGAAIGGSVAYLLDSRIGTPLVAAALAGLLIPLVVGWMLYRDREQIARLRESVSPGGSR